MLWGRTSPLVAFIGSLTLTGAAVGQCIPQKILASDGNLYDRFGRSVSISGNRAVIGAPWSGPVPDRIGPGAVYVFQRTEDGWTEQVRIDHPNAGESSGDAVSRYFGTAVDLDGDVLVVDDAEHGDETGAAYVFRWSESEWVYEAELIASDAHEQMDFGSSVCISGDRIVVGADEAHGVFYRSGAAYVFRYDQDQQQWIEEARLTEPVPAESHHFGNAVALHGDRLAVAAYRADTHGAVYTYSLDPADQHALWSLEQRLDPPYPSGTNGFGVSISLRDDVLVVGSYGVSATCFRDAGTVIFRRTQQGAWELDQVIVASDDQIYRVNGYFGVSVDFDGYWVVIGCGEDHPYEASSGSAYLLHYDPDRQRWVEDSKFATPESVSDRFAHAVAVDSGHVIATAYIDDELGVNAGAAYAFSLDACRSHIRPGSFAVPFGRYVSGEVEDLHHRDQIAVIIRQRASVTPLLPVARLTATGIAPFAPPDRIQLMSTVRTDASPPWLPERVYLWNHTIPGWELVEDRILEPYCPVETLIDTEPERFIDPGTHEVEVRFDWFDPGSVVSPNWHVEIDHVQWIVLP